MGKKIPEKQLLRLFKMGSTVNLKGFKDGSQKREGLLRLDSNQVLTFEEKKAKSNKAKAPAKKTTMPPCPKCKKGKIIKGKTAYGCSDWKAGCGFRFSFEDIFKKADGKKLTKALVMKIISG